MRDNLFWYKFRPKSLKNIILLPRVRELVKDGLPMNVIFYSESPGTGKSSLAKILCEDSDYVEFNSSKESSVDILRNEVERFCKTLNPFKKGAEKIVFFDEFDGVSQQFQKAMKGFSDKYQHVRFILTTNYINQIDDKILSRFTKVDFTPKNQQEIDYLSDMYFKYLKAISNRVKIDITDIEIKKLIAVNFPDLRSSVQKLQEIHLTQNKSDLSNISMSHYKDVFDFLMNGANNIQENWNYVMDNFQDKPMDLIKTLGRPFFSYFMENNGDVKKSAILLSLQRSYNAEYENTIDPIIHLISYVTDIKEMLKN